MKSIFSRKRFLKINRAFHLNLANQDVNVSRGMKLKNVVDYIDEKFREYYIPGKKI